MDYCYFNKARLCDNVKHKLYYISYYQSLPEDNVYNYSLWDLNRILVEIEKSLADFPLISFL